MDEVDRKIITLLANDSRISVTDMADEIPISISAASERLKRLTRSGAISRFTIELNPNITGRPIDALIEIRLPNDADSREFDEAIKDMPSIVNAIHLTGAADYQLRVLAKDVPELDELLTKLKHEFGVAETNTRLALRTVNGFPRLPALT